MTKKHNRVFGSVKNSNTAERNMEKHFPEPNTTRENMKASAALSEVENQPARFLTGIFLLTYHLIKQKESGLMFDLNFQDDLDLSEEPPNTYYHHQQLIIEGILLLNRNKK